MTGQLQAAPAAAPHRSDAGVVRLGQRDINGLVLCTEHYGAPYDLLAAAASEPPADLFADLMNAATATRTADKAGERPGITRR